MNVRGGPSDRTAAQQSPHQAATEFSRVVGDPRVSSQQVCWSVVHEHVAPILEQVGDWPMAGTPAWCELEDTDPRKWAALLSAAEHWALRVETCQVAACEAAQAISAAGAGNGNGTWAAFAQHIKDRNEFYAARPWMKRATA